LTGIRFAFQPPISLLIAEAEVADICVD